MRKKRLNKSAQKKDLEKNHQVDFFTKKAQMELSFGMIFSIILIVVFVAAAFYGIKVFLEFRDSSLISAFYGDFKTHVDDAYKGLQTDTIKEYNLPSSVKQVCFLDCTKLGGVNSEVGEEIKPGCGTNQKRNLFLYPTDVGALNYLIVEHLNMDQIISNGNPHCVLVKEGKLKLRIKKDFGENWVTITA